MKLYYPRYRCDGKKSNSYDAEATAYNTKLEELQQNAVRIEELQGDFYSEVKYHMPDGSVWVRTISLEYMLEYSLERM